MSVIGRSFTAEGGGAIGALPGVELCVPFEILVGRGGVDARSAPIAGIADIARHRRHRKGKALPLVETDLGGGKINPGVESAKSLFFGVDWGGGRARRSPSPISRSFRA